MTRLCVSLVLLLGLAGCAKSAARQDSSAEAKPEPPSATAARVEVATLKPSAAKLSLRLPGEVHGFRDAELAAPLGGYIEKVSVKVGASVKKGQALARVDSATHLARLAQAKVALDEAEREYKRAQALGDAIVEAERDAQKSRVEAAQAALRAARVSADRTVIVAPFAGTAAQVNAEVGEVAAPGTPLIRLVQLDPVKVTVSVPGRDVVVLAPGMPARVRADARAGVVEGKLSHIEPAADLKTRSFIVEIEVPNPDQKLLPGMIATVEVVSSAAEQRLLIPQDFLVTGLDAVGVFVNEAEVARFRPLELGQVVRRQVVVEKGLKEGDSIVITGQRELAAGDKLIVARSGMCCKDGRVVFE